MFRIIFIVKYYILLIVKSLKVGKVTTGKYTYNLSDIIMYYSGEILRVILCFKCVRILLKCQDDVIMSHKWFLREFICEPILEQKFRKYKNEKWFQYVYNNLSVYIKQ